MRIGSIVETRDEYLSFELAAAAGVLVRDVLGVIPGQQVVVTTDTRSDARVTQATAGAIAALGAVPVVVTYPSGAGYSAGPPRAVAAAVAACDVWVEYANGHLIYTDAWRTATAAGVQYASLGGIDVDGFVRCIGRQDVVRLSRMGEIVIERLSGADVHVTSAAGSDLRFHNRRASVGSFRMRANPEKRAIMLAGQVTWSLGDPATMTGTLVADGILAPPPEVGLLAAPVQFQIEGGRITDFTGGREADLLRSWMARLNDPVLRQTAHLSLGFNPGIPAPTGRILEDERAFGDLDFGWGAWIDRPAAGHFDFTCRQVTVTLDGKPFMSNGIFVDETLAAVCREMGVPGH